jgi:hypothetical protein
MRSSAISRRNGDLVSERALTKLTLPVPVGTATDDPGALVRQVSDWCSGAAAYFGWMREAKRENTRCGL